MTRVVIELPRQVVEVVNVTGTERTGGQVLVLNRLAGPPLANADIHAAIDAFEAEVDAMCEGE